MALATQLIEAMTGKNTNIAWSAAWKIIRCTDGAVLTELTYHIDAFQRARKHFPFVKGIRDRRVDLYLAILVLQAHRDQKCRCTLYPQFELFSVENEAQLGFVAIKSSVVHRELWEEHFQVECCGCGTRHLCKTIEGYHFPLWRWEAV